MTWREAQLTLQLEAELRKGARMQIAAELMRAQEDAAFASMATVAE